MSLYKAVQDYLSACETEGASTAETFAELKRSFELTTLADDALIAAARDKYCLGSDDDIEIDDYYVATSQADDGEWVQAWVWMPYPAEDEDEEEQS